VQACGERHRLSSQLDVPVAICHLLLYRLNQKKHVYTTIYIYILTYIHTYIRIYIQTNENVKRKQLIVLCRKLKKLLNELKIIKGQKDILYWDYKGTYTYIYTDTHACTHTYMHAWILLYYLFKTNMFTNV
jgi:hypothetical protein